jgi:predicted transcriptional regulator
MPTEAPVARKGLLAFLVKHGGSRDMRELHTHSLLFYGAGHQAFSQLMEELVEDELVVFEGGTFRITEKGRAFLDAEPSS